jgi:D-alanine-D-alanine ligase
MANKMAVVVVFGGVSGEHEVSIVSSKAIMSHLDPTHYRIIPLGITKNGHLYDTHHLRDLLLPELNEEQLEIPSIDAGIPFYRFAEILPIDSIDVIFPVLHGPNGEDGTIQGLLDVMNLPYVGCGVLGSAVGMDKEIMKHLLKAQKLEVFDWITLHDHQYHSNESFWHKQIQDQLSFPCFIKPCNMGSSVGVTRCEHTEKLQQAIELALRYDSKVIVERTEPIRELEIAVLGNENPLVSVPGEIVPCNTFYDYRAKYIDGESKLLIPAPDLSEDQIQQMKKDARNAFLALGLSGLARIDMFYVHRTGSFIINEVNTMPGFTEISMYPQLWEASGISFGSLVDRLIELGLERYETRKRIATNQAQAQVGDY